MVKGPWQGENYERNLVLVERLRAIGLARGATPVQLAIAWVLSRGNDIFPLIGARTRKQLEESLGALDVSLRDDDLKAIERAMPADAVAGSRYPEAHMAELDSERCGGGYAI